MNTHTITDLYSDIDKLTEELAAAGMNLLSEVLRHRMHNVTWTCSSELLEELLGILTEALSSNANDLDDKLKGEIESIIASINRYLSAFVVLNKTKI